MNTLEADRLKLLATLYDDPADSAMQARYCDFMQENDLLPTHAAMLQRWIETKECRLQEYGSIVRGPVFRFVTTSASEYRAFRDLPQMKMSIGFVQSQTQAYFRDPGYPFGVSHINPRSASELMEHQLANSEGYYVTNVFYIRDSMIHTLATTYREWMLHGKKWCHENPVQYVELFTQRYHTTYPSPFKYDAGRWNARWKNDLSYAQLHSTPQRHKPTPRTGKPHAQDCEDELSAALIHWARQGIVYDDPIDANLRDRASRDLFS